MTELFTILTKNKQTNKQTPTQKHPKMNKVSWYFPIKNFQESAGSSYKTLEKKSVGKGSAAGKPFNSDSNFNSNVSEII